MSFSKLRAVIEFEFKEITRGKAFIIMTLLGPILMGGFIFAIGYFTERSFDVEENSVIAVYSENTEAVMQINEKLEGSGLSLLQVDSQDEGKKLVAQDEAKGYIYLPNSLIDMEVLEYISSTGTDHMYSNEVEWAVQDYINELKRFKLGLTDEDNEWLSKHIIVDTKKISEDGSVDSSNFGAVYMIVTVFSILIMVILLTYGLTTARSVVNEKTTKTIEILLSSVDPKEIMFGKALGAFFAGMIQLTVWLSMGGAAIKFLGPALGISIPLNAFTPATIVIFAIFYIITMFFYLFLYASLGAHVENEQNLGQAGLPIQLIVMIPMMTISSIIANPDSIFAKVLSYIPFTSASVMSARMLINSPGVPMILLSIVVLIASLIFILMASSKLFRIGIITKGKKTNIIEISKLLFTKE